MPETEGPPPLLWPFPALAPVKEVLEWRTDVLPAQAGEQRIALRTGPRSELTLRHRASAWSVARAGEIARAGYAGPWLVPLWHMAAPVGGLASGATEIAVDTTVADYRAGGHAALMDATNTRDGEAALLEIATVEADRITLTAPLPVGYTHAALAPVRAAVLTDGPQFSRTRASLAVIEASFTMVEAPDIAASALPQYQGRDVLTDPSVARRPVASTIARAVEMVDNDLGPIAVEPARDITARGETITLVDHGLAASWARRQWLFSLAGRLRSFWLPTWGRELVLQSGVGAFDTDMRVIPLADLMAYAGRHVAVETGSGLVFREITGAAQDGADHRLTLSASLGTSVPPSAHIHWMPLVRLDTDRVEITHTGTAMESRFNVIEITDSGGATGSGDSGGSTDSGNGGGNPGGGLVEVEG